MGNGQSTKCKNVEMTSKNNGVKTTAFSKNNSLRGSKRRDTDDQKALLPLDQYDFPFENVVFEGGNNKLMAYCGAVRLLEDAGVWRRILRVSGSGSGALVAALLAAGYNSYQLEKFFDEDFQRLFQDHGCGKCCLGCTFSSSFGWSPGKKVHTWIEKKLKESAGKSGVTFAEAHRIFGKELCVVVTNLSQGQAEYCHPKTTPNMPVAMAVRMSMATPGLYQPVKYSLHGSPELFVEGDVLCNYPVHCFDGWWLSLKPDDSLLNKLTPITELPRILDHDNKFDVLNSKTIGLVVFGDTEQDAFCTAVNERNTYTDTSSAVGTSIAVNRCEIAKQNVPLVESYSQFYLALNKFMEIFTEQKCGVFSKTDFDNILSKTNLLTANEMNALFGAKCTRSEDVFRLINEAQKTEITLHDIARFFDRKCSEAQSQYLRQRRRDIRSITDYFEAVEETMQTGSRRTNLKKADIDRTIGINSRYIRRSDLTTALEQRDRAFLLEQGRLAAKAFLEQQVRKFAPPRLGCVKTTELGAASPDGESFGRDDLSHFMDDEMSEIIDANDYNENLLERVI